MSNNNDGGMTAQRAGDIAMLRGIVTHLESCLRITGDAHTLSSVPNQGNVQAMQESILRAAYATANALSSLGDQSAIAKFSVGLPEQARHE